MVPDPSEFTVVAPPTIRHHCKQCCYSTTSLRSASKHEQENEGHITEIAED